jgi:D-cysteine desulfhydrase
VADRLRRQGRRPYGIGRGGATPVGCLGYVAAALELEGQLAEASIRPSHVVLATGSCGTQAGLTLGAALAGSSYEVLGVTVSRSATECVERVGRLAAATAALLGQEVALPPARVVDGIGPGYGRASPEGTAAAELAARREGLLLDPAYTAKSMGGLAAEARAGRLPGPVVFLHTGGAGGLAR